MRLRVEHTARGWCITQRRGRRWLLLHYCEELDKAIGWAVVYAAVRGDVAVRKKSDTQYEVRRRRAFR